MKTIIHLLNSSSYSGAENVVITIIKKFQECSNFKFVYVSLDGSIRKRLEKEHINFASITRMSVSEVKRIIREHNPDIIHAHDFTAAMISALSLTRVPIICHLHNNSPWIKNYGVKSFAFLATCFRYKVILTVSSSIANEYVFGRLIKNKVKVVRNPIDISIIQTKAEINVEASTAYDVIFLGRLSPPKKPKRFISIIEQIAKKFPYVKSAMIGTGNLYGECKQQIIDLSLENSVDLLGFVENPYPILKRSKVLCITSSWEGYGLVAVEALSLGVPVVAPPVGGLLGIVTDKCGKICSDDNGFIDEISKLLSDSNYWVEKSAKALQRANELNNIEEYVVQLKNTYKLLDHE